MQDEHSKGRSSDICASPIGLFEALFQSLEHTNYILVTGPGISIQPSLEKGDGSEKSSYWSGFLKDLASWCSQNYGIKQQNIKEELLHFFVEEYLVEKSEQQRCLREILLLDTQLTDLHRLLAHVPFRGYISTTYDTLLEIAYEQVQHRQLSKFYPSSVQGVIEACQQGQPFILKLYGDIDEPGSLAINHRWRKEYSITDKQTSLRSLLTLSPSLFFGFEDDDPDFMHMRAVVDTYSPFESLSIPYSVVSGGQQKSLENLTLQKVKRAENNQNYSDSISIRERMTGRNSPVLFPIDLLATAPSIPDNTSTPFYNYVNSDLYGLQAYNAAVSVQEGSSQIKPGGMPPIGIYTAYANTQDDQKIFNEINSYVFAALRSFYKITCFSNGGSNVTGKYLCDAKVILILVSLSFVASNIWKCDQMEKALDRHQQNETQIIPIIVQPADLWKRTPFGYLKSLPSNGRAVSDWGSRRQTAYNEIVTYLSEILDDLQYG